MGLLDAVAAWFRDEDPGIVEHGSFAIVPIQRMKELEETEKHVTQLVTSGNSQLRQLRELVVEQRRVLEWYADRANWRPRGPGENPRARMDDDRGKRARKLLGLVR